MKQEKPNIRDIDFGRIPPQVTEIEEALLGCLIQDPSTHELISEIKPEMFYKECNQKIFEAIQNLQVKRKSIDLLTITEELKVMDALAIVGGAYYVTGLTKDIGSANHVGEYLLITKEVWLKRYIILQCSELSNHAYDDSLEFEELINGLEEALKFVINEISNHIPGEYLYKILEKSIENVKIRIENTRNKVNNGIPIPIGPMQKITGGWQRGDLVIIAARPGMGKSAVAVKFAKYAAHSGFRVLFFSLEMSEIQVTDRAALGETQINPELWRNGEIGYSEINQMEEVKELLSTWDFTICDKPAIRPEEIDIICKKEKPQIVFIDYIQLMKPPRGVKYQNKNLEIGAISNYLKEIARKYDIPVIALSQLNRDVERRGNKRPGLSDLRESGELEQDADLVIFPFRESVYNESYEFKNKIEFIIAKHRNGRIGIIEALHNDYMNDFYDQNNQPVEIPDKF